MRKLSMYERVMGGEYARLPAAVQRFHRLQGRQVLQGWAHIDPPSSVWAAWLARCLGSPRQGSQGPIRFELNAGADAEVWTRFFPAHTMRSELRAVAGQVVETLGPARLAFALRATDEGLTMALCSLRFCGLPCPAWLMPVVVAQEHGEGTQLHFKVSATLPGLGTVARYSGHLIVNETVGSS